VGEGRGRGDRVEESEWKREALAQITAKQDDEGTKHLTQKWNGRLSKQFLAQGGTRCLQATVIVAKYVTNGHNHQHVSDKLYETRMLTLVRSLSPQPHTVGKRSCAQMRCV
jgi:hypothetical protein